MLRRFLTLVGAVGVLGALASVANANVFPSDGSGGGLSRAIADTLYCALTGCVMTGTIVHKGTAVDITTDTNEVLTLAPSGYSTGASWIDSPGSILSGDGLSAASNYPLVAAGALNGQGIRISAVTPTAVVDTGQTGSALILNVAKGTTPQNVVASFSLANGTTYTASPLQLLASTIDFVDVSRNVYMTVDTANKREVLSGYLVVNQTSGTATHGATIEADTNGRGVRIVAPTNYSTSTFVSTGYGISMNVAEGATTNNVMSSFSNSNVGTVADMWHQAANTIWSNTTTQQAKLVNSTGELDLGPTTKQITLTPTTLTIASAPSGDIVIAPGSHQAAGNVTDVRGILRDTADNGNVGIQAISDNVGRTMLMCGVAGWTAGSGGTCANSGVQFNIQQGGGTVTNGLVSYSNHSTATKSGYSISSSALTLDAFGTGLLHSSSAGVITSAAVTLSGADVTGVLPVANGGTNLAYAKSSTLHNFYSGAGTLLLTNTTYDSYVLPAHAFTVQRVTGRFSVAGVGAGNLVFKITDGTNTCTCSVACTSNNAFSCTAANGAGTGCVYASSASLDLTTENVADCTTYPTAISVHVEGIWQ